MSLPTQNSVTDLDALKQQRNTMRRNIEQIKSKLEVPDTRVPEIELNCRLQLLDSYFKQISQVQSKIEDLQPKNTARGELEDLFIATKSLIIQGLQSYQTMREAPSALNVTSSICHANRLPMLKLPKFDGKYAEYTRFITVFKNLVDNDMSLSPIDKFNYLFNCLSGPALHVIDSFQITEENYPKALERLKERFDNKALIFSENIQNLFGLPTMSKGNSIELRQTLDAVSALRGSLLSLGSEADVMNAMLVHIVLSKIDSESKGFVDRNQDFTTLPSWNSCYKLLSKHCQYLESASSTRLAKVPTPSNQPPKSTRTFSAFFNSQLHCSKCKSSEHILSKCSDYLRWRTEERYNFVKRANLCINCLKAGHTVPNCSSKFSCWTCKGRHHTTLHRTISPRQRPTTATETRIIGTNADSIPSSSTALITRSHKQTLFPTAVILIQDKVGKFQPIRAVLDTCSDTNFITEEAAKRLQLKFVQTQQWVSGISNTLTTKTFSFGNYEITNFVIYLAVNFVRNQEHRVRAAPSIVLYIRLEDTTSH